MGDTVSRGALHDEHVALGAKMARYAGYEVPSEYTGIAEEVMATRAAVGVFDVGHTRTLRVFGFRAFDMLQALLASDLAAIDELGAGRYALMCDEDGGIVDDLLVYHSGDLEYLVMSDSGGSDDLQWMRSRCPTSFTLSGATEARDCQEEGLIELVDESERTCVIAVEGPRALRVIRELSEPRANVPDRFHLGEGRLGGVPVLMARAGFSGEEGVQVICHERNAVPLWRLLMSFPEVQACGIGARDVLRLEMGYPLYGRELTRDVDPMTAGLSWAVDLEKGPFIGRESLVRAVERGVRERLVGLKVHTGVPSAGYPVLHGETEVGKVASGTFSPTLREGIALAYVAAEHGEEGRELSVRSHDRLLPAEVFGPPFVTGTSLAGSAS